MRKIKILIFFVLVILLSGCSVEYNLVINEDSTVNESVVATEKTKRMESITRQKGKQAVMYLYDMFTRKNEDISIDYIEDDYNTYATAGTFHENINEFSNKFTSDVFEKIYIEKNEGTTRVYAVQKNLLGTEEDSSLIYDRITISIEVPFEVIDNNADSVKGNIYTWTINKESNFKKIDISYKEGNKKDRININVDDKVYNINYGYIVIGVILLIIFVVILIVYTKNKKNNKV